MSDGGRIRTLIVDDEPLARRRIRRLLAHDTEVEVIGECADGDEAVKAIHEQAPDLLFLDVRMPALDGFQVLEQSKSRQSPLVVFISAYDEYALRAFTIPAVHYLQKPFDRKQFEEALHRVKERLAAERGGELTQRTFALLEELRARTSQPKRLLVRTKHHTFFLKVEDIDWIKADGKYVELYVGRDSYQIRESISGMEARLDAKMFQRIHRSTIVNLDRVVRLEPWFHGEHRVFLRDGTVLIWSRNFPKPPEAF
ncbi:MAG TPA: LytTR family DNA-binding domain-containing protein [Polyangia bacterium]|jgi:two-component system LytT family response regulator|nr:LytTR family DNA-binding domain-containing protein [Polyangia bacterium]